MAAKWRIHANTVSSYPTAVLASRRVNAKFLRSWYIWMMASRTSWGLASPSLSASSIAITYCACYGVKKVWRGQGRKALYLSAANVLQTLRVPGN